MVLNINLYIKFRAFGVPLGTLHKQFAASAKVSGFSITEVPVTPIPAGVKPVLNKRGVKLTIWSN